MSQPSRTDPPPTPAPTTALEKDHARVFDMMNSAEMQKRLEEARAKRELILATRAAAAELTKPRAIMEMDSSDDIVPADVEPQNSVEPTAAPNDEADRLRNSSVLLNQAKPARKPSVLRAPPRPVDTGPAIAAQRSRPMSVKPPKFRLSGMISGLVVGMLVGVGVTQIVEIATPVPSSPTGRVAVGPGVQGEPAVTVEARGPGEGNSVSPSAVPGRSVVPKPRPAVRSGDATTVDRLVAEPSVNAAGFSVGSADRTLRLEQQSALAGADPGTSAAPPPIKIDDIIRSAALRRSPVIEERSTQAAAAAVVLPEPPVLSTLPKNDAAPFTEAEPIGTASAGGELRPQAVLHLPPTFPSNGFAALRQTLHNAGSDLAATHTARFGIAKSEVRYFHEQDAVQATRIAEEIGSEARDFSTYRPSPPQGTVEVWLGERDRGFAAAVQGAKVQP